MSEEEFTLWMQYDREWGLPDWRLEVTSGLHMWHMVGMQIAKGERPGLDKFMPFQPKPEEPEEEVDRMEMFKNA